MNHAEILQFLTTVRRLENASKFCLTPPDESISWDIPIRLKRRGVEMKLILLSGLMDSSMPDQNLIRLIAQAYSWFERLSSGAAKSVQEIADKDSVDAGDVSRTLPLAFLAPNIVEFILEGRQPKDWTAEKLKRAHEIPHCWAKQRHCLEFSKT